MSYFWLLFSFVFYTELSRTYSFVVLCIFLRQYVYCRLVNRCNLVSLLVQLNFLWNSWNELLLIVNFGIVFSTELYEAYVLLFYAFDNRCLLPVVDIRSRIVYQPVTCVVLQLTWYSSFMFTFTSLFVGVSQSLGRRICAFANYYIWLYCYSLFLTRVWLLGGVHEL